MKYKFNIQEYFYTFIWVFCVAVKAGGYFGIFIFFSNFLILKAGRAGVPAIQATRVMSPDGRN